MKYYRLLFFSFFLFSCLYGQKEMQSKATKDSLLFLPQGIRIVKVINNKIITYLPNDIEIQGILCRGHGNDWQTVFYKNGNLELAWLARDQEIQGYPCKKATFWTEIFGSSAAVHFHENGKLKRFKLAKEMSVHGHRFKKGDIIQLDKEGKLVLKK